MIHEESKPEGNGKGQLPQCHLVQKADAIKKIGNYITIIKHRQKSPNTPGLTINHATITNILFPIGLSDRALNEPRRSNGSALSQFELI